MTSRPLVACLGALLVGGCAAGGGGIGPEVQPFAVPALETDAGLVDYLKASGVEIDYFQGAADVERPHVVRATIVDFTERGACEVLTYGSTADAEQFGPRSGGGGLRLRAPEGDPGYATVRENYKPTYRFGRLVAVCSGEPVNAAEALRKLQAFSAAGAPSAG